MSVITKLKAWLDFPSFKKNPKRMPYIDIAKALLVMGVVYFHLYTILKDSCGIYHPCFEWFLKSVDLYSPFFMPAFFMITGFCSNFNKSFWDFLKSNTKSILLPMLTLNLLPCILSHNLAAFTQFVTLGGWLWGFSFWFLPALFLGKMLYWFINRISPSIYVSLILVLLFSVLSPLVKEYNLWPNWWYNRSAMAMVSSIWFGHWLKINKEMQSKVLVIGASVYIIGWILAKVLIVHLSFPGVNIDYTFRETFIYLLFSISGGCFILQISKWISRNFLLEYFGQGSLIVYCTHWFLAQHLGKYIAMVFQPNSYLSAFFFYMITFCVTLFFCVCFIYLLNSKYLRCAIGKF